jgi:hypothetical protein
MTHPAPVSVASGQCKTRRVRDIETAGLARQNSRPHGQRMTKAHWDAIAIGSGTGGRSQC